ncbi:hypothetical protein K474DRAFT_1269123 [Panus rudis PR-1116 ss-1]|nr:hypothetical protein K474DRAFT_1269123 [Panus rudis PR-1116 ss-1]
MQARRIDPKSTNVQLSRTRETALYLSTIPFLCLTSISLYLVLSYCSLLRPLYPSGIPPVVYVPLGPWQVLYSYTPLYPPTITDIPLGLTSIILFYVLICICALRTYDEKHTRLHPRVVGPE